MTDAPAPTPSTAKSPKTPGEIDAVAAAGAVVARALTTTRVAAEVGVRLVELDQVARDVLHQAGATSPFLGYQPSFAHTPYPGVVCLSVNDAVLHGIPTRYEFRDGDLLSVDCGATLDGWTGDAAISSASATPAPRTPGSSTAPRPHSRPG